MTPFEIVTDTQTELKLLIKDNISETPTQFRKKVESVVLKAVKDINYNGIQNLGEFRVAVYGALIGYAVSRHTRLNNLIGGGIELSDIYTVKQRVGLPSYAYQQRYKEQVKQAYNELIASDVKYSSNVSLRNISEQIVRNADFDNKLESLKEKTNLVIMSYHTDCADDHKDWQGKVYSLDGTTGRTEDGREYVPIETVTGSQPKGIRPVGKYNCRHTFSDFKTYKKPITVSASERKKEYEITKTQRLLEREVRNAREKALMYRGVDDAKAKQWRQKAIDLREAYERYSKANERAFYRSRLSVI